MKVKTNELSGQALDWAVAKCEGYQTLMRRGKLETLFTENGWTPSTDWAQSGPIIEREGIALYLFGNAEWNAHVGGKESIGPTPLIAAMRCYVASKLGEEVEVPKEEYDK